MTINTATLKTAVNLPDLVLETHLPDHQHRVLCPVHDDSNPSCVVYPNHVFCFTCGFHADAIGWLQAVHGLDFAGAIAELEKRVGTGYTPVARAKPRVELVRPKVSKPVATDVLVQHRLRAARLERVPAALEGRGFTLEDLIKLGTAAYGQDAVLPITDPTGRVLALKRRYAVPSPDRYRYTTTGCGTPAWSSPDFLECDEVLLNEGELNGMAAWLARPELGVQGIAGANGQPHLAGLKGRTVYVYGDGDEPGQKARDRWAAFALNAGAAKVFVIDPWPMDACDIAGKQGRAALRELLT